MLVTGWCLLHWSPLQYHFVPDDLTELSGSQSLISKVSSYRFEWFRDQSRVRRIGCSRDIVQITADVENYATEVFLLIIVHGKCKVRCWS
jgi:hypothetical protein